MKTQKRNVLCLFLLLTLLFSLPAHATETDPQAANTQYASNDSGSVPLYDETGTDITAVLENGASVTVTDRQNGSLTFVRCGEIEGWIRNSDLSTVLAESGETTGNGAPLHTLTPIATESPAEDMQEDAQEDEQTDTQEEDLETDTDEAATTVLGDPEKDHEPIAALYDGEGVEVVQLGVLTSLIVADGERQLVDTALLTFGEDVPAQQQLGYVHAPRTGQAGLRENPAKDGKVITQLRAGQLFAVLALEEGYARINVQGVEGWLRLDCLRYLEVTENGVVAALPATAQQTGSEAPAQTPEAPLPTATVVISGAQEPENMTFPVGAMLSLKGETDGTNTVNLRNQPTKESAKAAVWRTGAKVTVLALEEGWYLVEADGVVGYVMAELISFEG